MAQWNDDKELFDLMKKTQAFDTYMEITKEERVETTVSAALEKLLEEKNINKSKCIEASGLDSTYAYQIFSGIKTPSRDKLLALCLGMGLTLEETQTLLKQTGYPQIYQMAREDTGHPWLVKERKWHTLVLSGRLSYQKNHMFMLRVLSRLCRDEDYRLILLGIGELEAELKKACAGLGIRDSVDFYGYTKNPYSFYADADAVVLCSRYEGLPTVLIEALACGARIVSVDCRSGPDEILAHGKYGTLVEPGKEELFAQAVRESLREKPDKDALRRRAQDFSLERSADGYLRIVEELVNGEKI